MEQLEDKYYDWVNCMYVEHLESEFYYPDDEENVNKTTMQAFEVENSNSAMEPEVERPSTSTSASEKPRFVSFSADEVAAFVGDHKNKNTVLKTKREVAVFEEWKTAMTTERRPLTEIPPSDLDPLLAKFFLGIRKKNGDDYEPDSISSYQKSIERWLRDNDYGASIIRDEAFASSRRALAAKRKQLKAAGKGNLPNKSEAITSEHENTLLKAGQLGVHSASSCSTLSG
ncbi:uncharacterized protein KIAA1958-like [Ptychodera flava]|uniref:uncharacterized protein KIAA1958-like n=1 Tax=Ptychodera flava TaxID=63121 RepID=UPI003969F272